MADVAMGSAHGGADVAKGSADGGAAVAKGSDDAGMIKRRRLELDDMSTEADVVLRWVVLMAEPMSRRVVLMAAPRSRSRDELQDFVCLSPGMWPIGARFRDELQDFVCLSPGMCIEYRLRQFQRYPSLRNPSGVGADCLTEEVVIGTAGSDGRDHNGVALKNWSSQAQGRRPSDDSANSKPYLAWLATSAECARPRRMPGVSLLV